MPPVPLLCKEGRGEVEPAGRTVISTFYMGFLLALSMDSLLKSGFGRVELQRFFFNRKRPGALNADHVDCGNPGQNDEDEESTRIGSGHIL